MGQDEPWEQRKTEARILQRVRWVRRPHGAQGEEEDRLWKFQGSGSGKRMCVCGLTFLMLVMESRVSYRQSINPGSCLFGGGIFSPSSPT